MDEAGLPGAMACPRCDAAMVFIAITLNPTARSLLRRTFLCRPCNRTQTYMLLLAEDLPESVGIRSAPRCPQFGQVIVDSIITWGGLTVRFPRHQRLCARDQRRAPPRSGPSVTACRAFHPGMRALRRGTLRRACGNRRSYAREIGLDSPSEIRPQLLQWKNEAMTRSPLRRTNSDLYHFMGRLQCEHVGGANPSLAAGNASAGARSKAARSAEADGTLLSP
jgi:hypothetical protein